jgi:hypothetical protein
MSVLSVSLGVACAVAGGVVGLFRLSILLVVGLSGFVAFTLYHAFSSTLSQAISLFGVADNTAIVISVCLLTLLPLFGGIFLGIRAIGFLGLRELAGGEYGSPPGPADKIFGSGFALVLFIVLFNLFNG